MPSYTELDCQFYMHIKLQQFTFHMLHNKASHKFTLSLLLPVQLQNWGNVYIPAGQQFLPADDPNWSTRPSVMLRILAVLLKTRQQNAIIIIIIIIIIISQVHPSPRHLARWMHYL